MKWTVESSSIPGLYSVYDEDGNRVARDTTHDRASLIAAAPDLRAALKAFADECPDDIRLIGKTDHPVTITVRLKHLRQARAALEAGE